jgi:hypothetical protein
VVISTAVVSSSLTHERRVPVVGRTFSTCDLASGNHPKAQAAMSDVGGVGQEKGSNLQASDPTLLTCKV